MVHPLCGIQAQKLEDDFRSKEPISSVFGVLDYVYRMITAVLAGPSLLTDRYIYSMVKVTKAGISTFFTYRLPKDEKSLQRLSCGK